MNVLICYFLEIIFLKIVTIKNNSKISNNPEYTQISKSFIYKLF